MARLLPAVVVDVAYHVTQRGNSRQLILATDSERGVYLDLLGGTVVTQFENPATLPHPASCHNGHMIRPQRLPKGVNKRPHSIARLSLGEYADPSVEPKNPGTVAIVRHNRKLTKTAKPDS